MHWNYVVGVVLIFEWVLRFLMFFIVPKNRKPSSSTAWLMLIMIEPILGSIIFSVFGSPSLPRHRRDYYKKANELIEKEIKGLQVVYAKAEVKDEEITSTEEKFVKLNRNLGGFPIYNGNKVKFYDDYNETIKILIKDIDSAKERILFEYFILALDSTSEPIFEALERAHNRGVNVYVLFDALACRAYPNYKKMKKRLSASGIAWRAMLPLYVVPGKKFTRPDLRNHRKIVVIDGKIGCTGSQNIIQKNYHRSDELYYEELVARIEGPTVWQLSAVFRSDWYSETQEFLPALSLPVAVGSAKAQVLPSGPSYVESSNLKLYTALMHGARKKIVIITPYFVPDDALMTALTSAAQRGVEVTMINSEIIDKVFVGHAQRSYYEELLRVGVKILLYKKPVFLHTKHLSVDDSIAVIGSSNLDMRSFELDLEVSMVLYDKQSVLKLRKIEERIINGSKKVSYNAWQKRSIKHQLLDNVARLTASLQ